MEVPCKYRFVGSPKELSKVENYLHGHTYKGDEKRRSVTIPSEDKNSLSMLAPESVPSPQEKKLGANEQNNSFPSSSTAYNDDDDDEKLNSLQMKHFQKW